MKATNFTLTRIFALVLAFIFITLCTYFAYLYEGVGIALGSRGILTGLITIITSPVPLVTDFLKLGGFGASFLNAFIILLFNYILVKILKVPFSGLLLAAFFTVFGFSFFGKNIINILPIYIGGILYSKYDHSEFKDFLITMMFSSALAPFISEVAFGVNSSDLSYINAIALGGFIGFIVTPMAKKMATFHEGFNLYNLGFTGGFLGAILMAVLVSYKFELTSTYLLSEEFDGTLKFLCSFLFSGMILIGLSGIKGDFPKLKKLFFDEGLKSDFVEKYGVHPTLINMGLNGFVTLIFITIVKVPLSGPILAGVFTVVGFSAYGKTVLNITPIMTGVYIASFGTDTAPFTIALSALFGTSLAPVAGVYGIFWGIVAGWLHLSVVKSVGSVHGGLNLYNNGFSAGIVASSLLPLIRVFKGNKDQRLQKYYLKRKELYTQIIREEEELEESN